MSSLLSIALAGNVCTVTLNRPDLHNAFNAELITELTTCFTRLSQQDSIRAIILTGAGKSFSAGADLNWMRSMAAASEAENRDDSLRLAGMFRAINECHKPVIARINGHAFGGGVGIIACADIAVCAEHAKLGLTEVKLGLIPATIAPFVQSKIGTSHMRRYAMSGAGFSATQALHIGLVHDVVTADQLDSCVQKHANTFLQAGPQAVAECKQLIARVSALTTDSNETVDSETAAWIARLRVSPEGQDGLQAFLTKTTAGWQQPSGGKDTNEDL